jgi:hypothetical protein
MPGIIISVIFKEQLRLIFRATPWQKELACPTEVLERAAEIRWNEDQKIAVWPTSR